MSPRARGTFGNKYLSGDPSQAVGKKQRQVGRGWLPKGHECRWVLQQIQISLPRKDDME